MEIGIEQVCIYKGLGIIYQGQKRETVPDSRIDN